MLYLPEACHLSQRRRKTEVTADQCIHARVISYPTNKKMALLLPTFMYNHGPFGPNCRPCHMDNVFMDHPHGDLSGLFDIFGGHPWFVTAGRRHPGSNTTDQIQCPMFVSYLSDPCCGAKEERKYCKNGEKPWIRRIKTDGFSRDDVTVKIKGRQVLVEGEKRIATGDKEDEYDTVRMTRDLHVSDDVNETTLRVFHGTNGELLLVAKYKQEDASVSVANREDDDQMKTEGSYQDLHDNDAADFDDNKCECDEEILKGNCSCSDNEASSAKCACPTANKMEEDQNVSVTMTTEAEENETLIAVRPASEKTQTAENKDDAKMMNLKVDLSGFKPEEIEVKVKDERLIIHARHEDKTDGNNSYREVYRAFTLPADADMTSLESRLKEDGTLHLQASLSDIDSNDHESDIKRL